MRRVSDAGRVNTIAYCCPAVTVAGEAKSPVSVPTPLGTDASGIVVAPSTVFVGVPKPSTALMERIQSPGFPILSISTWALVSAPVFCAVKVWAPLLFPGCPMTPTDGEVQLASGTA